MGQYIAGDAGQKGVINDIAVANGSYINNEFGVQKMTNGNLNYPLTEIMFVINKSKKMFITNGSQLKPLLFDTGANVHITFDHNFEKRTAISLKGRGFRINIGGGPVEAEAIGLLVKFLTGPFGEKTIIRMFRCLLVPGFPVKILFGKRWYLSEGLVRGDQLVNSNGKAVTKFNIRRRGFFLWQYGGPKLVYRDPGDK
jgi:hypothetical protein